MSKFYENPTLLIEFDESKYFALQGTTEIGEDISHANLSSKLVLLSVQFPKMRIIWSPSQHFTASLVVELKRGRAEPSIEEAAKAGLDSTEYSEQNLAAQVFFF